MATPKNPKSEWKPITDALGNELVTIIVGPKRKEFVVHKKLICDASDYFRKAFDGNFQESKEGKIYLKDESAGAVPLLIEWFYRSRVQQVTSKDHFFNLLKLYPMAEMMCLDELADRIINAIMPSIMSFKPLSGSPFLRSPDIVQYIWDRTKAGSPLRKFWIMVLAWEFWAGNDGASLIPAGDDLKRLDIICKGSEDFFHEFFTYLRNFGTNSGPHKPSMAEHSACDFHCHNQAKRCGLHPETLLLEITWDRDSDDENSKIFFADIRNEDF